MALIGVPEAAKIVGCSMNTIRRAFRDGELPGQIILQCLRVEPKDLKKWADAKRKKSSKFGTKKWAGFEGVS